MKTRLNIANKNGYIFFDGKLQAYEFKGATVNFESGVIEYECNLGGQDRTLQLDYCPKVYVNEEAYRVDNGSDGVLVDWARAASRCFDTSYFDGANNDGKWGVWTIDNNEAIHTNAPLAPFRYDERMRVKYVGVGNFYGTKEKAMLYCDIIKVDADGTETIKPSPSKLVSLDDEQRKVMNDILDAFKRAKELDMRFVLNYDGDDMNVYSAKNIDKINYDCVGCENDNEIDITDLLEEIDLPIISINLCDCGVFATWK
jgi:hypothetical protein